MSYAWTTPELIDEIANIKDVAKSRLQWQEAAHYLQEAIELLEWIKEEEAEQEQERLKERDPAYQIREEE